MSDENTKPPTRFSVVIPNEMRIRIQRHAKRLGTPESVVVKMAIVQYLDQVEAGKTK